jgi:LCP family protein required for cell wall assembly
MAFETEQRTSHETRRRPQQDRKRHTGRNVLLGFVAFFLVAAAVAGVFAFNLAQSFDSKAQKIDNAFPDESTRPDKVEAAAGPSATNMLLLGSDSRAASVDAAEAGAPTDQRSDTMMWVHIPADRKNIYIMSILRDTWVDIPGRGESKMNSAMAFGGIPLTVQTLENMFDTRLDNVAIIDFEGFKAMTDALGGVEVNVPVAFNTQQFSFPAGKQDLTGEEALAFVRERKAFGDGDYQRVKNQQVFLKAILSRFLTAETLTNPGTLSKLVDTVSPYVSVDSSLDAGKAAALGVQLRDVRASNVTSFTLPTLGIGTSADGQSIVLRDDAAIAEIKDALKNDTLGTYLQQSGVASEQ